MITPHNNSRGNNRLLLLMEKATLTFRISQLSNQLLAIFYSFWGFAITLKDIRLVFLSNEKQQKIWPYPWEQQIGSVLRVTVWHLYNSLTSVSSRTLLLLDRFLRVPCSCHPSAITDDVHHITMSSLCPEIVIFTMQFQTLKATFSLVSSSEIQNRSMTRRTSDISCDLLRVGENEMGNEQVFGQVLRDCRSEAEVLINPRRGVDRGEDGGGREGDREQKGQEPREMEGWM